MKQNEESKSRQLSLVKCPPPPSASAVITRDFRVNPKLCGDFDDLLELGKHRARIEQQEAKLQARIQDAMGQAQKAVFTHGYALWVKGRDTIDLNTEAVLAQFPQLLDEFGQVQLGPRTLELHGQDIVLAYPDGCCHEYE